MENLKKMKECLIGMVESQIYGNIDKVSAEELGEAVDMIKDLSEAIYYCTITEAMEGDKKEEHKGRQHGSMYYGRSMPPEYYPDRVMYAGPNGTGHMGGNGGAVRNYHEGLVKYPDSVDKIYRDGGMRDPHEGRSGPHRKMYMDGKGIKDKSKQMQELEAYMNELAQDMTEMINDASPEEKQLLQNKLMTLTSKIK